MPEERRQEADEALASLGDDGEHPIHLFFSSDALHEEMPKKVRQVSIGGETIPLVSPEHLIVRKTLLDRPKDHHDIKAILARTSVDLDEVDTWVQRLSNSQIKVGWLQISLQASDRKDRLRQRGPQPP